MLLTEKKIPLVELFGPTIQGEGAVIGLQTYFLRFGLCDYKCRLCDSMHAVDPKQVKANAQWLTQEEILHKFLMHRFETGPSWVTFSGGNPCIYDLEYLVKRLKEFKFQISVETQGTWAPEWVNITDSLVVSPKAPGIGEITNIDTLDEFMYKTENHKNRSLKVVVFDQQDLEFAALIFERYSHIGFANMYLSLGNSHPPDFEGKSHIDPLELQQILLRLYRQLYEDISIHPVLSQVKFLPQWHTFVWGNDKGH